MRLLYINLITKFRGLKKGSKFQFNHTDLSEDKIEPFCFVGLNGSGKSNLLEVICEIFYYLENYVIEKSKPEKRFKTDFGFEIGFKKEIQYGEDRELNWESLKPIKWDGLKEITIVYIKQPKQLPTIYITNNEGISISGCNHDIFILPQHVIAYSSGQNELLSNPFIKSTYNYFDSIQTSQAKNSSLELGLTRLFYLDYDRSRFITICNYLFSDQNEVSLLSKELKLDIEAPLDSFSITIRFQNYRNQNVSFASTLQQTIEKLKSCATAIDENKKEVKLAFKVDEELCKAFKRKFGSAILLFRDLFYLNLQNIHLHGVDIRNKIKVAPSQTFDNLNSLVPVPLRDKLIFDLDKIRLKKIDTKELIKYKNLSDGEHQLLHVLGSIMLLNTSGSIFLYDEPETHFNPEWRSQLITLINKATIEKDNNKIRKQEIIISSHSPFIVSDCRSERVLVFKDGIATTPDMNTFGASVNLINMKVFGKTETISEIADGKIKEIRKLFDLNQLNKEQAFQHTEEFGESIEKTLLINYLLKK